MNNQWVKTTDDPSTWPPMGTCLVYIPGFCIVNEDLTEANNE